MVMDPSVRTRVVATLFLCGCLAVVPVWYGSLGPAPLAGHFPDNEELVTDSRAFLGDRVVVHGRVVATDPTVVRVPYGPAGSVDVTVVDAPTPSPGTPVEVFGVLTEDRRVRATNVLIRSDAGRWYAYTVSFVAGLWTLSRILRDWRFDFDRFVLVARERSLTVRETLAAAGLVGRDAIDSREEPTDSDATEGEDA